MKNIYIYKITNLKTEDIYIGIRETDKDIYKEKYKGENTILRKDLRQYGKKAFVSDIIAKDLTTEMAELFIAEYKKFFKATVLEDILDNDKLRKESQKGKNQGSSSKIARKVICLNTNQVFASGVEASIFAGVSKGAINKACRPGHPTRIAGKDKTTKEPYKWMYLDEYEAIQRGEEYTEASSKMAPKNPNMVAVICETTGEEFNSILEASKQYNISSSKISENCNYFIKFAGLHPDTEEELVWRYKDKIFKGENR